MKEKMYLTYLKEMQMQERGFGRETVCHGLEMAEIKATDLLKKLKSQWDACKKKNKGNKQACDTLGRKVDMAWKAQSSISKKHTQNCMGHKNR